MSLIGDRYCSKIPKLDACEYFKSVIKLLDQSIGYIKRDIVSLRESESKCDITIAKYTQVNEDWDDTGLGFGNIPLHEAEVRKEKICKDLATVGCWLVYTEKLKSWFIDTFNVFNVSAMVQLKTGESDITELKKKFELAQNCIKKQAETLYQIQDCLTNCKV